MKKAVPSLIVLLFVAACGAHAQTTVATLEGIVVNAQNERVIPRATVLARNVKNANDVLSVRADDSGHFSITNLKPGSYRLTAEQQSFYVDPHRRVFQPIVDAAAGELRSDLVVRLQPTAVVTGQIVDEHNDPMEHVQVKLLAREYHKGRLTLALAGLGLTDDRGEYRIYDVRPASYYLLAEVNPELRKKGVEVIATTGMTGVIDRSALRKEDGRPVPPAAFTFPPLFFPATSDFLEATSLPIHPGDEAHADFVFFSMPSVSVSGVVLNGLTGERVKNAAVAAYWTDIFGGAGGNIAASSKQDGTFEIPALPPGKYTLRTSFTDANRGYTGQQVVEVGVHGLENVTLAGEPDFDIEGRVLFEGDTRERVSRVSVDFAPQKIAGAYRVATDGKEFAFQGRMRPGELYTLNVPNLPADYYLKEVRMNGHVMERNQVQGAGQHGKMELVVSTAGGHVEGQVVDAKDQPVAAAVLLVPDDDHKSYYDLFRKGRSDREGKYTFRGVPPGTYTVIAFDGLDPDELINDPDLLKTYQDRGQTVLVSEGGRYAPVVKMIAVE